MARSPDLDPEGKRLPIKFDGTSNGEFFPRPPTVIEMDPPIHRPFRQIISKRFTPRALKKIDADVERIAQDLSPHLERYPSRTRRYPRR